MVLRKRLCLLFFLVIVSATLLSTSSAGTRRLPKCVSIEKKKSVDAPINDLTRINIHRRLLTVHTNDYGTYDPAPTFHKPKFKLIPN